MQNVRAQYPAQMNEIEVAIIGDMFLHVCSTKNVLYFLQIYELK